MASGLAFGAGSAVAHKAVDAVMGGGGGGGGGGDGGGHSDGGYDNVQAPPPAYADDSYSGGEMDPCMDYKDAFRQCIEQHGSDIASCQNYFDMLNNCKENNSSGYF